MVRIKKAVGMKNKARSRKELKSTCKADLQEPLHCANKFLLLPIPYPMTCVANQCYN